MNELVELIEYFSHNENLTNKVINNFLEECKTKKVCIFGAGMLGRSTTDHLKSVRIDVDFFCDNDNRKCNGLFSYLGIPCYSYEKLKELHDKTVVLIASDKASEIAKQLEADNIHYYLPMERKLISRDFWQKNNISDFRKEIEESYSFLEDDFSKKVYIKCLRNWFNGKFEYFDDVYSPAQYFSKEIMPLGDHESFADIGAFDGDTTKEFIKTVNKQFEKIYAFELTKESFHKLEEYKNELPLDISNKIELHNVGIGQCHEDVWYNPQDSSSFARTDANTGLIKTELAPLDDIIDERITFIKMDIEGAELSALKGAKKTIQKYKPKLAICIYHKPQDLWEIPLYIKESNPSYKLFLRHHTVLEFETVCYAV